MTRQLKLKPKKNIQQLIQKIKRSAIARFLEKYIPPLDGTPCVQFRKKGIELRCKVGHSFGCRSGRSGA